MNPPSWVRLSGRCHASLARFSMARESLARASLTPFGARIYLCACFLSAEKCCLRQFGALLYGAYIWLRMFTLCVVLSAPYLY